MTELRFESVVTLEHTEGQLPDYQLEAGAASFPFNYSPDDELDLARARERCDPDLAVDQARGRAFEFKRLIAIGAAIQLVRLRLRGGHEFHRVVIKRIDQNDKTFGLVAVGEIHDRNAVEHDVWNSADLM